jgi:hypothetical protein
MIAGLNEGVIGLCNVDTGSSTKGGNYMIYNLYGGSYTGGIAGVNNRTIGGCNNYGNIYSVGGKHGIAAVDNWGAMGCSNYGVLTP